MLVISYKILKLKPERIPFTPKRNSLETRTQNTLAAEGGKKRPGGEKAFICIHLYVLPVDWVAMSDIFLTVDHGQKLESPCSSEYWERGGLNLQPSWTASQLDISVSTSVHQSFFADQP